MRNSAFLYADLIGKHNSLLYEYDKLKEQRDLLFEALNNIIDLFPIKPTLPISYQVLDIAHEAIKKCSPLT